MKLVHLAAVDNLPIYFKRRKQIIGYYNSSSLLHKEALSTGILEPDFLHVFYVQGIDGGLLVEEFSRDGDNQSIITFLALSPKDRGKGLAASIISFAENTMRSKYNSNLGGVVLNIGDYRERWKKWGFSAEIWNHDNTVMLVKPECL